MPATTSAAGRSRSAFNIASLAAGWLFVRLQAAYQAGVLSFGRKTLEPELVRPRWRSPGDIDVESRRPPRRGRPVIGRTDGANAVPCRLCIMPHQSSALSPTAQSDLTYTLVFAEGGVERRHTLAEGANVVGRSPTCNLVLNDSSVSRWHVRLAVGDGRCV